MIALLSAESNHSKHDEQSAFWNRVSRLQYINAEILKTFLSKKRLKTFLSQKRFKTFLTTFSKNVFHQKTFSNVFGESWKIRIWFHQSPSWSRSCRTLSNFFRFKTIPYREEELWGKSVRKSNCGQHSLPKWGSFVVYFSKHMELNANFDAPD